jgi:hypothetical protein
VFATFGIVALGALVLSLVALGGVRHPEPASARAEPAEVSDCGSSADGLWLRRGAGYEPERKIGFGRKS